MTGEAGASRSTEPAERTANDAGPPGIRTAIVVGASRGLGRAMARALADRGADVVATVRDRSAAGRTSGTIRFVALDLNEPADAPRLRTAVPDAGCDLLLVNAGILGPAHQSAREATRDEVATLFMTNAVSPVRLAGAMLDAVRPGGVVAFMSSRTGSIALNESGDMELYRASKAALNALARSFAVRDALPAGKGVLMLHPGWVQTDMGGADAPVEVADSVAGMIAVVRAMLDRPAHRFVDYRGVELAW